MFEYLLSSKTKKIVSTRLNEKWFVNNGHADDYMNIINTTKEFEHETFSKRVHIYFSLPAKMCPVCGSNCRLVKQENTSKYKWSVYCSDVCYRKEQSGKLKEIMGSKSVEEKETSNQKRKQSMIEKYGVEYNSQRQEVKEILSKKTTQRYLSDDVLAKLNDPVWLKENYSKRTSVDIAHELGVYYGTVIHYCLKHGIEIRSDFSQSVGELEMIDYIRSLVPELEVQESVKIENSNFEMDCYIPSLKTGFEYHGCYWHSELYKDKQYHYTKWKQCSDVGIKLYQFFDDEWNGKKELVKKKIRHALGLNTDKRIYARQCEIIIPKHSDVKQLLESEHIQGHKIYDKAYGLAYQGELVAVVTMIGNELERFATKHNIIGGFGKLLNVLKSEHNTITTYANLRFSGLDNIYSKHGFELVRITKPNYFWVKNDVRHSRQSFTKSKLKQMPAYQPELTESEIMHKSGYVRIYDCGHARYVLKCENNRK